VTLFEFANWDKITPGVTVLDISLGGLSQAEAADRLAPAVEQQLDRPLDISAAGTQQTWHTTASDLGLRLDPGALAAAAYQVGRTGNPLDRFGDQLASFLGGSTVSLASTTDASALDDSLATMAQQVNRPASDAQLSIASDGTLQSSSAQAGVQVDIGASRDQLSAALNNGSSRVTLVTTSIAPAVTDDQLQTASAQATRLFGPDATPLTVTFADKSWTLDRGDLASIVSLTGGPPTSQPAGVNIDDKALKAWAAKIAKDVDQPVQNARFAFNGGNLKVLQSSAQGRTVDQDALVKAVHDGLLGGSTSVQLQVSTVDPQVSSDDPQSLGIDELIDRGSTSFAGSIPEKKHNIQLAAQKLNGIVVPPGATFSFNDAIGPTTLDAGFQWGYAIAGGSNGPQTVPSVAGGICQVATTLFQPVFWAGYQLEERYWHLYWIPAYTSRNVVGLDVTVDGDAGLDFKWTNTTDSPILIQSDSDDSNVYFGLYGKKPPWTVKVDDAVITHRVPTDPMPLVQEDSTMPWGRTLLVESARDGFDAEVVRHVIPTDGSSPRVLDLKSVYQPARTVTLVGSAGKPASASIDAAMQRVLDAQRPATEAKPNPTPATTAAQPTAVPTPANAAPTAPAPATARPETSAPAPAPTVRPQPTTAAVARPGATATAVTRPQAAPTAKPQVVSTTKPASVNGTGNGIAPTPTPNR
jgi:vancomycin resistance protein YoaR